jgi:hypothetical protein
MIKKDTYIKTTICVATFALFGLFAGLFSSNDVYRTAPKYLGYCYRPSPRLFYIFPLYKLGCYLGSPKDSTCYDYESCKGTRYEQ